MEETFYFFAPNSPLRQCVRKIYDSDSLKSFLKNLYCDDNRKITEQNEKNSMINMLKILFPSLLNEYHPPRSIKQIISYNLEFIANLDFPSPLLQKKFNLFNLFGKDFVIITSLDDIKDVEDDCEEEEFSE